MHALIVEDDTLMGDLIETVVAGLDPVTKVYRASTMRDALAQWSSQDVGLLLVDWNLPDGDGLTLIRTIRDRDQDLPIVMLTGRTDRPSIVRAVKAGITDYIGKPFRVDLLHERLSQLLASSAEAATPEPQRSLEQLLADGIEDVIQLPSETDPNDVLALIARSDRLSADQLAERWQSNGGLTSRLLDVANGSSFKRTGQPVNNLRDAIALIGVPMALNQALALSLDVAARFRDDTLKRAAQQVTDTAETVAKEAAKLALALGKRSSSGYFIAGLMSRVGELAVLRQLDHYARHGGTLSEAQVDQCLRDWAAPYGNRLKIQWHLPLQLRQRIGAVHYLARENNAQDCLIMRAAALLTSPDADVTERNRILRLLGLEDWVVESTEGNDEGVSDDR